MPRFALLTAAIVCLAGLTASAAEPAPKFMPLFNGKDLDGWAGDPDLWHVESGAIVGSTDGKPTAKNTFLVAKQEYKNFILKLKFKLRNHNSGVQFRSEFQSKYVVSGYQADIADNSSMGMLYEELGRGRLKLADRRKRQARSQGRLERLCDHGRRPTHHAGHQWLHGRRLHRDERQGSDEGVIALQLHAGPAMKVEFKDIEIAELP